MLAGIFPRLPDEGSPLLFRAKVCVCVGGGRFEDWEKRNWHASNSTIKGKVL
jgi:hypothetical protein